MADPPQRFPESAVIARFKQLLKDIATFIDNASEEQKQTLLGLLRDSRPLELLKDLEYLERRQHSRKTCSLDIDCATWKGLFDGTVKNISLGGMFVETDTVLSPGQEITANLSVPNHSKPIRITGKTMWNPRRGVGVQFTSQLSKELKKIIESL